MTKIKSALLLSVLSLLGISSSFGQILTYNYGTNGYTTTAYVLPPNLLTNNVTTVVSGGTFGAEGTGGIDVATNGSTANSNDRSQWVSISTGASLTYYLDTSVNTQGYTVNALDLLSGWNDTGRSNVTNVTVSYELVGSGTFTTLLNGSSIVNQNLGGMNPGSPAWAFEDVNYANGNGSPLITGINAIKFDFGPQENGYVGYQELNVAGVATVPEPSTWALLLFGGAVFAFRFGLRKRSSSTSLW